MWSFHSTLTIIKIGCHAVQCTHVAYFVHEELYKDKLAEESESTREELDKALEELSKC